MQHVEATMYYPEMYLVVEDLLQQLEALAMEDREPLPWITYTHIRIDSETNHDYWFEPHGW